MAERIVYQVENLHKFYEQREVLKGITLAFHENSKIGLIGANGAGKSTFLRILAGEDKEFEGVAQTNGDVSVGYLSQEPQLDPEKDVKGNIEVAVNHLRGMEARYYEVMTLMGEAEGKELAKLTKEFDHLQHEMDVKDIWNLDQHLEQAMHALQVPDGDRSVDKLSGGEKRRVGLCQLLLEHPDMLLLDEPTNHLDADSIQWLETYLHEYQGLVILITHDRYFLDNVVGTMLEVAGGLATAHKGNYSAYLESERTRLDVKRKHDAIRDKHLEKELEWMRRTPKAQTTQSNARLKRYQEMADQVSAEEQVQSVELRIPPGPRLGDKVVHIRGLTKGYGDRILFEGLEFDIPPQAKLGVIGGNGRGKTTLLRLILGQEEPDAGRVEIGSTVVTSVIEQSRDSLDDGKSVFENITEGNQILPFGRTTMDARAYVSRFNFKGEDQVRKLGECSGGMRNRVLLAKMLRKPANLIIMDEPTNDLDLETLRVLEEGISHYPGCMIIVTHDRYFLDKVATHILAFEEDGNVVFHHGDFNSYKLHRAEAIKENAGTHRKFARR
ncbi:MAG: energy-dependent translational throttle protein EttA [Planctomycetota bacterium]|nr:energy-dependent translational throttle protein EttA [Planctomycetota bacterium]